MTYLAPFPSELQQVEFVQLYFHLQVKDTFDLPQLALLQLRRELLQAIETLESWSGKDENLKKLFKPMLAVDPIVRKQTQKPAPAFVISPDPSLHGLIEAQKRIVLPVLFFGQGVQSLDAFILLLQQLGQQGLYKSRGQFLLEAVESEDASEVRAILWSDGQQSQILPPINDLCWLLERKMLNDDRMLLDIISPLRLLKQKKPVFSADFTDLFPFILRRVSSVLTYHAGVEVVKDPQRLLSVAGKVHVSENRLQWRDWRRLKGERDHDLGGLLGQIALEGDSLAEIAWVLQLGSLFNVGKGAAYGAGQYRLRTYC